MFCRGSKRQRQEAQGDEQAGYENGIGLSPADPVTPDVLQLKMPEAPAKGDTARLKRLAFEFVHNNKMFAAKVFVLGVLC